MRTENHAFCGLFTGKAGPERETAANAFCDRHDVGDNAILLIGEEAARTHDPALHFIKYEEHVLFVANRAQTLKRSEERRAGHACGSTCSCRGVTDVSTKSILEPIK